MTDEMKSSIERLAAIDAVYAETGKWIRITVTDDLIEYCGAKTIVAVPRYDCFETIGDDDLIPAIEFELLDGQRKSLAGQWIESWEVEEAI